MTTYEKLIAAVDALPEEAIERTKKELTRKGYDTTGYQYQFIVNVLNEVVGPEKWDMDWSVIKEIEGVTKSGQATYQVTVRTDVWIEFDGVRAKKSLAGGHISTIHADALKGAITNGFKKTVALFGVGKKAYEGMLDDDYAPIPEEVGEPTKRKTTDDLDL